MSYIKRLIDTELQRKLAASGAVLIRGAKACGKTESAKQFAKSILQLDRDENIPLLFETAPKRILMGETPRLIDEWQVLPKLWDHVRHEIDERQQNAQFILTGSAHPEENAKMHSGAGRFTILDMRTMSWQELGLSSGKISLADLTAYKPKQREPLCIPYRQFKICSMAPPSSGGLAVLQMMGMLAHQPMAKLKPNSIEAIHLISQAGKLAFADRERFAADPDFVKVPVQGLLAADYLKQRATLLTASEGAPALAGEPEGAEPLASGSAIEFANTSHLSVVDSKGNAVSMTTSIENVFGSGLMVGGFLLNNQLTDFSLSPEQNGYLVANRVEGGKRPRSSMAPMMVFDQNNKLKLVIGSPGGSRIINYVAQSIVAVLDWKLDVQQALSLPRITHRNDYLALEKGTVLEQQQGALEDMGYQVQIQDLNSGLHAITISEAGLQGAADPRREGRVAGE